MRSEEIQGLGELTCTSQEAMGGPTTPVTPALALVTLLSLHYSQEHRGEGHGASTRAAATAPTRQVVLGNHGHSNLCSER